MNLMCLIKVFFPLFHFPSVFEENVCCVGFGKISVKYSGFKKCKLGAGGISLLKKPQSRR